MPAIASTHISEAFTPEAMHALEQLRLRARSISAARFQGSRKSRERGRSLDFTDYRHYVPGDDPRDLDWNAVARFDALLIRLFAAEVALPLELVVDGSKSMAWPETGVNKFTVAMRAAAALALVAARTETPVHLASAGSLSIGLSAQSEFRAFLTQLDRLAPANMRPVSETMRALASRGAGRTVVLFTDGYDLETLQPALRGLRATGAEAAVILTLSPWELAPELDGDLTLTDAESSDELRVSADSQTLRHYRERLDAMLALWKRECRRTGAAYGFLSTDTPLAGITRGLLLESGLARRRH